MILFFALKTCIFFHCFILVANRDDFLQCIAGNYNWWAYWLPVGAVPFHYPIELVALAFEMHFLNFFCVASEDTATLARGILPIFRGASITAMISLKDWFLKLKLHKGYPVDPPMSPSLQSIIVLFRHVFLGSFQTAFLGFNFEYKPLLVWSLVLTLLLIVFGDYITGTIHQMDE